MRGDARILLGGPQGTGLETAAQVLTTTYARRGYHVYSTREYHSNIKGRHSYIHLRVHPHALPMAPREKPHVIANIDAESVFTHFTEAARGTLLIFDINHLKTDLKRIASMEPEVKARIIDVLATEGYGTSVADATRYAEEVLGARTVSLDYRGILAKLAERAGIPRGRAQRYLNTILISSVAIATGLEPGELEYAFKRRFKNREELVHHNLLLASIVADEMGWAKGVISLEEPSGSGEVFVASGNDVVAMGKIAGGLRIQTYYPITPAADESTELEARENLLVDGKSKGSILVVQTEDEIAAISAAIGAALAGARSATATSGPGFDLMVEALGWAGNNEAPVVITYYQRGGPSTGLPTRGGQQDLYSAVFSGHGEFPRIVISSGDHEEAFYDAIKALNWAEEFQLPVIHLLDKFLANSIVTLPVPDPGKVDITRGYLVNEVEGRYLRFDKSQGPISPRAPLGTKDVVMWYTGDEHNAEGHITEEPMNRLRMHAARMEKSRLVLEKLGEEDKAIVYGGGPDFLLVGWGSTKGVALEVLEELSSQGLDGSYLHVRLLEPFPSKEVRRVLQRFPEEKVIAVEASFTNMIARLITMNTGKPVSREVLKWTGRPFYVEELAAAVRRILVDGSVREVLTHGF